MLWGQRARVNEALAGPVGGAHRPPLADLRHERRPESTGQGRRLPETAPGCLGLSTRGAWGSDSGPALS